MNGMKAVASCLEDGEHPILGHWKDSANWLLTTTRRVIWTNHQMSKVLS